MNDTVKFLNKLDLILPDILLNFEMFLIFVYFSAICTNLFIEWKCSRSDETRINHTYYRVCM